MSSRLLHLPVRQHLRRIAGALLASLLVVPLLPAAAQSGIHLRPSYADNRLPAGSAVVVLRKPADAFVGDRPQPEFLDPNAWPTTMRYVLGRDTLISSDARTRQRYAASRVARGVYFIYVRTPQNRLYGSYSAEMGGPKFDVAQTGVMSVAPILGEEAPRIDALFFGPEATLAPPEPEPSAPDIADDTLTATDTARAALDSLRSADADSVLAPTAESERLADATTTAPEAQALERSWPLLPWLIALLAVVAWLWTMYRLRTRTQERDDALRAQPALPAPPPAVAIAPTAVTPAPPPPAVTPLENPARVPSAPLPSPPAPPVPDIPPPSDLQARHDLLMDELRLLRSAADDPPSSDSSTETS